MRKYDNSQTIEAFHWGRSILSKMYEPVSAVKAECLFSSRTFYGDNKNIENLFRFISESNRSKFDSLITRSDFIKSYSYPERIFDIKQLREIEAINAVLLKQYSQAVTFMELAQERGEEDVKNPFAAYWNDWTTAEPISDDNSETERATKLDRIKQALKYSITAATNPALAAEAYYRLGNFRYNIFKYGTSYEFFSTPSRVYEDIDAYHDPAPAKEFYESALSKKSTPELKAKILAMMAKCELYSDSEGSQDDIETLIKDRFKSIIAYKRLKSECENTAFYKEMIKECGYFRSFLGKR